MMKFTIDENLDMECSHKECVVWRDDKQIDRFPIDAVKIEGKLRGASVTVEFPGRTKIASGYGIEIDGDRVRVHPVRESPGDAPRAVKCTVEQMAFRKLVVCTIGK